MEIEVNKHDIFTDSFWSFTMPDHEHWKKQLEDIITVEKNKEKHNFSNENNENKPVQAHKTSWDSHYRYPSVFNIMNLISTTISQSIEQDGWETPKLNTMNCWINWYEKNQYAKIHNHHNLLSVVYFAKIEKSPSEFFFHREDRFRLKKKNEDSNIKLLTPKEGSVIFFNGCQAHSVSANTSEETRITLAINFNGEYSSEFKPII
jgi:hypothetical protein